MTKSPRPDAGAPTNPARPERIVRVMISGRVQGVGYRAWTRAEAESLGVAGWVRNRTNGDVEALIAGRAAAVEALCERLWRGPLSARVVRVELAELEEIDFVVDADPPRFYQIATI